jgi:Beta-lactamase enzyme family
MVRDAEQRGATVKHSSGRVARASRRGCGLVTAAGLVLALGLAGPAGAQAAGTGICESSAHPALAARLSAGILAALRGRSSAVGLRVVDRRTGVTCSLHPHWHFASASVVKVTILAALLRKLQQEHKALTSQQRALATEMITESDNQAASLLWTQTGRPSLQHFLDLAQMGQTELGPGGYWGLTEITAHDEMFLLKLLTARNSVLSSKSRGYVQSLMAHVVSSERWGVTAGAPADVTGHVKNGWLPLETHGWRINSIGSFSGRGQDYMIVMLTMDNPTMAYGIDTIQGAAEVINRELNPGAADIVPPAVPAPSWGTPDEPVPGANSVNGT